MPLPPHRREMSALAALAEKAAASVISRRPLPMIATVLIALVPLRAVSLMGDWQAAHPQAAAPAALQTAQILPPVESGQKVITLADGVTVRQTVSATLAGGPRLPSPVGDERPVDGKLLAEVARRQAELDKRQQDLETRSAQVDAAEKLAKQQIAELTKLRAEIEALVVHESTAADSDLDMLVGLYQNMKPMAAAAVLGKMEPQRAGLILQKLGDRSGGPILAAMDPTAALAISEEIAQRRSAFRK